MNRKLLFIIPALMLSACASTPVPVVAKFPEVPAELKEKCPDLSLVDPKTEKISEVLSVVVDNYSKYHECRAKVDNWIEWYNSQKDVYEKVK